MRAFQQSTNVRNADVVGILRLVRAMQDRLDEHGLLSDHDKADINNAYYTFLRQQTQRVQADVLDG